MRASLALCLVGNAYAAPKPSTADATLSACQAQLAAAQQTDASTHRRYVAELQSQRAREEMMVEHDARRMAFVADRMNRLDNFILAAMAASLVTAAAAVALLLLRERAHATVSERNTLTTRADALVTQGKELAAAVDAYRQGSAQTVDAESARLLATLNAVKRVRDKLREHADKERPNNSLNGAVDGLNRRIHEIEGALAVRAKSERAHEERVRELAEQARNCSDSAHNLSVRIATLRAFPAKAQVSAALIGTLFLVCTFVGAAGAAAVWGVPMWELQTANAMPQFASGLTCTATAKAPENVSEAGDTAKTHGTSTSSSPTPTTTPTAIPK